MHDRSRRRFSSTAAADIGVPAAPRLFAAGLRYRSIADTARATLACEHQRDPLDDRHRPFSLTPERERAALEAWAERSGA